MSVSQATLARRTMGAGSLIGISMVASSPQTVLNGGIPTMYGTGVLGVPLAFLVVMVVLAWLSAGSTAMSRHVLHGAPFYAQLALGFGPTWGLVGAGIALVGYSGLQISLYAVFGTAVAGLLGFGAWWMWAAVAWSIVLPLGQFPGAVIARFLGVLLACEIGIVLAFDAAGFANPAAGTTISLAGFAPSNLLGIGAGGAAGAGALVFAGAAYAGAEALPAFGEEARSPRVVAVATYSGYALLGILYALTAWAYATVVGPADLANAEQDPANAPMAILDRVWGPGLGGLGIVLLLTSVLASMSAFHGFIARYIFALGRENVLPTAFAAVTPGKRGGAPKGGAATQAATSAIVVAVFAVCGADPMQTAFVWLSTIGAVCVLILLMLSSFAAQSFFAKGAGGGESPVFRFALQAVPFSGGVLGILALAFMLSNLDSLLGLAPGSRLPWLIGGLLLAVVLGTAGVVGRWLRANRPQDYARLGQGTPDPVMVRDARLEGLQL